MQQPNLHFCPSNNLKMSKLLLFLFIPLLTTFNSLNRHSISCGYIQPIAKCPTNSVIKSSSVVSRAFFFDISVIISSPENRNLFHVLFFFCCSSIYYSLSLTDILLYSIILFIILFLYYYVNKSK